MNAPTTMKAESLPNLIDRAASALTSARNSGEVLEARDFAKVAYDAAKAAGRMARAKDAHDDLIAKVYRAQADALLIESQAKARLADEYDAAQERGEVKRNGGDRSSVEDHNTASSADLGLRRDQIHEARQLRDAEKAEPGLSERALGAMVDRGEEPTRAQLRRSVLEAVDDAKRSSGRKERNPHHKPNPLLDRVSKLSGLCERIAEFDDIEEIARFGDLESAADRLAGNVEAAIRVLQKFKENRNA